MDKSELTGKSGKPGQDWVKQVEKTMDSAVVSGYGSPENCPEWAGPGQTRALSLTKSHDGNSQGRMPAQLPSRSHTELCLAIPKPESKRERDSRKQCVTKSLHNYTI